jgi:ribonucleotide monophosphatase NagD (HAD superfamily)
VTYCFDLDGTLCTDTQGDYERAAPFPEMVAEVNRLHREGHHVIILTARGSGTGIDWRATTERQLAAWGVAYDFLFLGKPPADVYVDDKAVNVAGFRLARLGRLDPGTHAAVFPPFPAGRE